jgi:hypothetical protein
MSKQRVILDNTGTILEPTSDENLWIGWVGNIIDIRLGLGTYGAPLVFIPSLEELQMGYRQTQLNLLFL